MCHQKSKLKNLAIVLATVFFIVILLYIFRGSILVGMGKFLVVENPLSNADIIYLLTGEVVSRPSHAVELYRENYANTIVVPQHELIPAEELGIYPNPTEAAVKVLLMKGINKSDIIVIDFDNGVTSTKDEAYALLRYINKTKIKKVILVTSNFHSYRAKHIFNKVLKETPVKIIMSPAPHWKFNETNWWKFEEGLISCTNEYLKFIHYLLF
jgi:uncharacterized SAM-binding protein YcdF (DUF218 family)